MKPKLTSRVLTQRLTFLALGAFTHVIHAQATRTWDGGGFPANNMDLAGNWNGDVVPTGAAPGDTAQWDGSVAGALSLTYTALAPGTNLAAGNGLFLNVTSGQTSSLTINEAAASTAGLRIQNLTVASGAGAVTFGGTAGTDYINLGSSALLNHLWTNNSSNPVTFASDVAFGAGGAATHALTLTGTGSWNVNGSLIKSGNGTINVIKDGAGALNIGADTSLGNATFTINAGTLDNTSGAARTTQATTNIFNGDFAFSTGSSTNLNDLLLGAGAVNLGASAGTSRTITTNGAAMLTVGGVIANGTTANNLIKSGTGGLKLDGTNTFTGGFTLNSGLLHFSNNAAFGTGTLTLNGGSLVPRIAARTVGNATAIGGGGVALGQTDINNALTFTGAMSLGGAAPALNVVNTTVPNDVTVSGVISNGGLTKTGAGTLAISGANTYSGATTINAGLLRVDGAGSINSSSGITINGADAKFLYNSSVASTPPVTLTQGSLDASGTIGAVNVGDATTIANGNGGTAPLTTGNLNFAGTATVNVGVTSSTVGIAAGTLTTSGADSAIVININKTGSWSNGPNNLISFTSLPSADINDFDVVLPSTPSLGARQQFGDLVINGNNIALEVIGTSVYWTGLQSNQWTTATVAGAKNWKKTSDNLATDFLIGDDVVFNDTPGSNQTVQLDDDNVVPTTTTFNNSTVNYTIASANNFGINDGTLTKNGTGSVTINTANGYFGGTILNAGTLNVGNISALGTGAVTINDGTLNNTSAGDLVFLNSPVQTWNGDFTFTGTHSLDMGSGLVTTGGAGDRTVTVSASTLAVGELKTAASQGFIKQGSGTLALTSTGAGAAASVVNGTLNVAGGTLQINRTGAADANNAGDLTATGLTGTGTVTNGANFERWLVINTANPGTFGGTLTNGAGTAGLGFQKQGAGAFTLTGNNSYSGATTVNGSTLTITGTNSLGGVVSVNGSVATPAILNLQNSNALGTSVVTSANRNSGVQLQGGIVLPSSVSFFTSNDGTSGATVPYAIASVSGDNVINGSITLRDGGGSSIFQSEAGASLKLTGNVSIITGQGSRGMIFQGDSTGANEFSGKLSDLSVTSIASIIKNGTGTWTVSGVNTYTGVTTVNGGTLLVTGDSPAATGLVTVNPGGTLGGNGNFGGALTVAAGGHHALEVAATSGAQKARSVLSMDLTAVGDILDLTAAATPADGPYILVHTTNGITGHTSGVLNDTVVNLNGVTGTVSVVGNDLVLNVGASSSAFSTWISGYSSIPVADRDPGDDPDGDGLNNQVEFALGGSPASGSDNAKIYSIVADSDFDGDSLKELLLTIAVRNGTGAFTGTTSKSAPSDDPTYGYTVQGSLNLTTFGETVNVVPTAVPPVGVTLPSGYTWKTFSLSGSNGATSKGFMRVLVTP